MGANHAWVAPGQLIGDWLSAQAHLPQYVEARARVAGAARRVASLGDLCSRITQGPNPQYTSNDYPCVITRNVASDQLQMSGSNWVSAEEFSRLQRFKLQRGDILVTLKGAGSTGKACVFDTDVEAIHSREVGVVRVSDNRLNPRFLCAYFQGRFGRLLLDQGTTGSTGQLTLSATYLKSFPVPLPDRRIQDYIGAKVELAERCRARALLEGQRVAAAFEELLAESQFGAREGRSRWVPGDEMVTRWLNAGYYRQVFSDLQAHLRNRSVRTVPLASVAHCNRGKSRPGGVVRYIEISDIDIEEGAISGGRDCTPEQTPKNAQRIVRTGDVLMSTRRPDRGAVACVTERDDGAFCSVFLARIQCDQEKVLPRFLQEYLRRPSGKLFIAQRCTETTYPVISEDDIETIPIPLVPRQVQERISAASRRAEVLRVLGVALVGDAKADVEALIEGTLDVQAILAGTVKAPTADDIPELAEDGA
jgi:type I restriction enzyme S subunit